MSTYLRKCIDLAPTAVVTPGPFVANDYRNLRQQSWWPALRATTSYLRLWADWPSLQRVQGQDPGFGPEAAASLAALDAQVEAAYADGLKIIMLPYRYPRWANETESIAAGAPDLDFRPWDRWSRLAQYTAYRAGTVTNVTWKAFVYRMPPEGHGPGTQWARYVEFLWERYADRLTAFEVVNEPNGQLWPQRTTIATDDFDARWGTEGTTLVTPLAVAEMMTTVDAIARAHGGGPLLLAPSTSDSIQQTVPRTTTISHRSEYTLATDTFVEALLPELARRGFVADDRWIWAYHNYTDFERGYRHVVYLRKLLAEQGWNGRQLDGGPEVWCTEGGCRLAAMTTRFRPTLGGRDATAAEQKDFQARVLTEALGRHHYAKGAGAGVGMVTQYTTFADPNFDDGLLDAAAAGGAPRPALAVWSNVPEYLPAPVQRAAWRPQP
jgi:hypothetical protein